MVAAMGVTITLASKYVVAGTASMVATGATAAIAVTAKKAVNAAVS